MADKLTTKFSIDREILPHPDVECVSWSQAAAPLGDLRRRVFIEEQGVPEDLEWDGEDDSAQHVLARVRGRPVACGRLLKSGQIGRMAVLPEWRKRGIGSAVLAELLDLARNARFAEVFLHAQLSACAFYARHGFVSEGEVFDDAGIAHVTMRRRLAGNEPSTP